MKKFFLPLAIVTALVASPLAAVPAHADTDRGHHAVVTQEGLLHKAKAAKLVIDEPKAIAYFTVTSGTASVHWAQREDRSGYTIYVIRNGATQKVDQYQITNAGESVLFAFLGATKAQLDTGVSLYKTQLAFTSTLKRTVLRAG